MSTVTVTWGQTGDIFLTLKPSTKAPVGLMLNNPKFTYTFDGKAASINVTSSVMVGTTLAEVSFPVQMTLPEGVAGPTDASVATLIWNSGGAAGELLTDVLEAFGMFTVGQGLFEAVGFPGTTYGNMIGMYTTDVRLEVSAKKAVLTGSMTTLPGGLTLENYYLEVDIIRAPRITGLGFEALDPSGFAKATMRTTKSVCSEEHSVTGTLFSLPMVANEGESKAMNAETGFTMTGKALVGRCPRIPDFS